MGYPDCSVIIHTRNEEKNISGCIKSAQELTPNILIVDMESSDQTVMIAQKLGATTYSTPNQDFVEPARNYGLSLVTTAWVLILDADERLPAVIIPKLQSIMSKDQADIVSLPRQNLIFGKWIKHGYWWPDYQVRLFKVGTVKWNNQIHTQPTILSNRHKFLPARASNSLIHTPHPTIHSLLEKIDRYTTHQEVPILSSKAMVERLLTYPDLEFIRVYIEKYGFLDGMEGYILARYMEFYEFTKLAKAWEKQKSHIRTNSIKLYNLVKLKYEKNH